MTDSFFKDKVVIITGASSGIGRELAYQLATQGAWLSLAARNVKRLETVSADCQARGGKAIAVPTDVGDQAQCEALIRETVNHYKRIDVSDQQCWHNNVGQIRRSARSWNDRTDHARKLFW